MTKIRENGILINIVLLLVVITSIWGVMWSLIEWGIADQKYFTNQANLIVAITVLLFFVAKNNNKWFPYLAAITLINITMTGIIYHVMLATPPISFQAHLTHTLTPILYFIFYFLSVKETIKIKQFWVLLIHPFVYFIFFLVTGPFTGFYPYGFMNVSENGLGSVLQFIVLMMMPAIALLSIVLIYIKNKIEKTIKG